MNTPEWVNNWIKNDNMVDFEWFLKNPDCSQSDVMSAHGVPHFEYRKNGVLIGCAMYLPNFMQIYSCSLALKGAYLLFKDMELVYVGVSNNIKKRISEHKLSIKDFDAVLVLPHSGTRDELFEYEKFLIKTLLPKYNITHSICLN